MLWIAYPLLPRYASIFLFHPLEWQSRGRLSMGNGRKNTQVASRKDLALSHCTVLIVAYINLEFPLRIWALPLYIAFAAKQGYRMFQHKRFDARLILLYSAQQFSSTFPEWFKPFVKLPMVKSGILWSHEIYRFKIQIVLDKSIADVLLENQVGQRIIPSPRLFKPIRLYFVIHHLPQSCQPCWKFLPWVILTPCIPEKLQVGCSTAM